MHLWASLKIELLSFTRACDVPAAKYHPVFSVEINARSCEASVCEARAVAFASAAHFADQDSSMCLR